jgi:anti-sigma B factor antagonist
VDLRLSARAGRASTVVAVGGEIDMATCDQLHDFVQQVVGAGALHVVLDFAEVTFMDSSGLGVLTDWFKRLRDEGGRLSVAAVTRPVQSVLRVSAVDQVLGVYDSVENADAAG